MKNSLKIAVLLAFALTFAACGNNTAPNQNDQTPTLTLSELLETKGGNINLNEYTIPANSSFTIGSTATLSGDAKNADFTIAEGAEVTFKDTKNIGTVNIGTSNGNSAAKTARAAKKSTKISLQGKNVKISKLFIYIDCKLDSDNQNNSFGSIVVAATVSSLELEGNTKVESLVSMGTSALSIKVSASVKIEKADPAVIKAVKENNPGIEIEIPEIPADESESPEKPTAQGNFIKSKEDLIACIKNIIKEYYDFAQKVNSNTSRAAAKDEIAAPFIRGFDEICKKPEVFSNLFLGNGVTENINFDEKVDLINVKFNDGVDAFIDIFNHVYEEFYEGEGSFEPWTKENFISPVLAAHFDAVNDYVSVPKLYANASLNAKKDDPNNYASGSLKIDIQTEVHDINEYIPKFLKICNFTVPQSVNLPVENIKLFWKLNADARMTEENYNNFVSMIENMPSSSQKYATEYIGGYEKEITKSFSFKYDLGITTKIQESKQVPGGIITVSYNVDYNDFKELLKKNFEYNDKTSEIHYDTDYDPFKFVFDYINIMDIKISVKVTDYSDKETYSLNDKNEIKNIFNEIKTSCGEIFQ